MNRTPETLSEPIQRDVRSVPAIDPGALAQALSDHCLRHQLPEQEPDRLRIELGLVQGEFIALQIAVRAGLVLCQGPADLSAASVALCAPDGTIIVTAPDLGALAIALIDRYLGADAPRSVTPVALPSAPAAEGA